MGRATIQNVGVVAQLLRHPADRCLRVMHQLDRRRLELRAEFLVLHHDTPPTPMNLHRSVQRIGVAVLPKPYQQLPLELAAALVGACSFWPVLSMGRLPQASPCCAPWGVAVAM